MHITLPQNTHAHTSSTLDASGLRHVPNHVPNDAISAERSINRFSFNTDARDSTSSFPRCTGPTCRLPDVEGETS